MSHFRNRPPFQFLFVASIILFSILSSGNRVAHAQMIPDAQESHPGLGMESRFAEAIIAYNKQQVPKALAILDELIKISPSNKEYLEMKALALKGTGDPKKSLEVYLRLYQVSANKDKGPYAFELGTLYTQLSQFPAAQKYFEKAYELNFNTLASQFYMGLSAFQSSSYGVAEKNFRPVSESALEPYSLMSKYYLGISYFKLNNGSQGVQQLVAVRNSTRDAAAGSVEKTLGDASSKMLAPFSYGHWFGNIVLQSQFDSNVQLLPTTYTNPTGTNNPATMKMNFSGGGGYMTAPLDRIQWVAGYRASYNYNFNANAKGFQYFTNNASLYANYNALAATSAGLKVESSYAFQNALTDAADTSSAYQYQKYNFTMGGGFYIHHQLDREWKLEIDLGGKNQLFYADSSLSGLDYTGRVAVRSDLGRTYFNPGVSAVYENNRAHGDAFYSTAYGVGLMNTMNFPGSLTVGQSFDVLLTKYGRLTPSRSDKNYSLRVNASKMLNAKYSLLADAGYIKNVSSVPETYTYNQFVTSLGLGYSF
jgi:tetratricopeptide (TPR) repeat protein